MPKYQVAYWRDGELSESEWSDELSSRAEAIRIAKETMETAGYDSAVIEELRNVARVSRSNTFKVENLK